MEINDSRPAQNPAKKERDSRTNLRDEYFAERRRIIEQLGDLEAIRMSLGLNRRQLCRVLLVDPSAWTRWIRTDAPPHIYQALRWLLELRGIRPEVVGPANISTRLDEIQAHMHSKIQALEQHIEMLERTLALTRVIVTRQTEPRPRAVGSHPILDKRRKKRLKKRQAAKKQQVQPKRRRPPRPKRKIARSISRKKRSAIRKRRR